MRIVAGITALLALLSGCYRSHTLPARDGGLDAPRADAPFDAPPRIDAPPTCRASCEPAVSLMRFESDGPPFEEPQLVVRGGTALVLFGFGGDLERYMLFRVDARDGVLRGRSEIPLFPPPERNMLMGAFLGGPLEALELTWLEAPARSPAALSWRPFVRQQRLNAVGRPTAPVRELGMLERRVRTGEDGARVSVLGRERVEGVAIFAGELVGVTPIDGSVFREEVMLAHLDEAPVGIGPIDGVSLADGRTAIACGGTTPRGEVREALLVLQLRDGSVLVEPIPGELEDPPADIVASGDGLGLFRVTSNPHVLDPLIHAEVRDPDGVVVDSIAVSPAARFAPTYLAAFDFDGAPAVAWIERDRTLRILPPPSTDGAASWAECDGIATSSALPAAVSLPGTSDSGADLVLAALGDGTGDVLVLAQNGGTYELFRVPGCRLDRID